MLQLSRVIASCDMGGGGSNAGMSSFQVWVDAIGEKQDSDTIMQRLDANLSQFIMNLLDKFHSNRRSLCKIFFKITPNTREFPHKREPFVHVGEVHLLHMLHNATAFRSMLLWLQNWKPMFGIKSGIWNISLGKACNISKYIQIVPNMLLNHRRLQVILDRECLFPHQAGIFVWATFPQMAESILRSDHWDWFINPNDHCVGCSSFIWFAWMFWSIASPINDLALEIPRAILQDHVPFHGFRWSCPHHLASTVSDVNWKMWSLHPHQLWVHWPMAFTKSRIA